MATYRYVGYDLLTSLRKMFDDADIRMSHVLYWISVIANRIRVDQLGKTNTGLFTSTFSNIPINTDSSGKKYIDLPASIMDLQNESGVEVLTYCSDECNPYPFIKVFFQPTTIGESMVLYMDEYTKPDPKNPYFYRIGDKVDGVKVSRLYLLGIECIEVRCLEAALKCSIDPTKICDLDDEIPIPDERIEELMTGVLQLGRFVMMIPDENINQGSDNSQPAGSTPPEAPATNTEQ